MTALVAAIVALAFFAASATSSAAGVQPRRASGATGTATPVGTMSVRFTIQRFVRRAHRLYAVGTAIARFTPTAAKAQDYPTATVRKAFTARVKGLKRFSSAQRICPILDLTLGPLDLNLLGLMIHLDLTHLTIKADSEGGLLGQLLCSLTNRHVRAATATHRLTRIAHRSGLATRGVRVAVPLYQYTSSSGSTSLTTSGGALSPLRICPILNLTLGPLDLNVLGLPIHLDTFHLTITADSEGGILGQLLCGLAGGGRPSS